MNGPGRPRGSRPELWRRAGTLFEHAIELPEGERSAFLARVCGPDLALREAVEELLAFDTEDAEADSFAEVPVLPGRVLGAYRLVRPIAQGGMASVWLAERTDGEVEQQVAIKWTQGAEGLSHPWAVPLFRRERRILARLEHPNIARFLDGGTTEEGIPYAVLEYVEGVPLTLYCDLRRLSLRERLALFFKVCGAVQYAHRNLVVHRDLKPDNILVGDDGEPKLLDFGIAKPLQAALFPRPATTDANSLTVGRFLTPDYASPEQIAGQPVSISSDLYSLGVLLHELLTGLLPSRPEGGAAEGPSELVGREAPPDRGAPAARAGTRVTTLRGLRRALRGDLDAIVLRCLERDPGHRYGSVEQLADDLRRHLDGLPVQAQPPSFRYRSVKFVRRHKVAVAAGGVLALAALAFVTLLVVSSRRVARERDAAREAQGETEAVEQFLLASFRSADPYQRADLGATAPREMTVREMLDRSAERAARDFGDRPLVQARLYQSLGGVYVSLGRYDEALPLLRRSLELRRKYLGPEHPDIQISTGVLGYALNTVGRLEEAEPLMRESLRLTRKLPGLRPQMLAEALTSLGMLEDDLGHLPEAEAALREAETVYKTGYSKATALDRPLAITSIQLGAVLYERKSYAEARVHLQEALANLRHQGLTEHPDIASALHYLAKIDQVEKRYGQAEATFRQALAMRVKTQGAEHPQTIVARAALGKLLVARGAFAEAERLFREVAALDGKVYGKKSAEVADDLIWIDKAAAGAGRGTVSKP